MTTVVSESPQRPTCQIFEIVLFVGSSETLSTHASDTHTLPDSDKGGRAGCETHRANPERPPHRPDRLWKLDQGKVSRLIMLLASAQPGTICHCEI